MIMIAKSTEKETVTDGGYWLRCRVRARECAVRLDSSANVRATLRPTTATAQDTLLRSMRHSQRPKLKWNIFVATSKILLLYNSYCCQY